jgi:hypothetical protein
MEAAAAAGELERGDAVTFAPALGAVTGSAFVAFELPFLATGFAAAFAVDLVAMPFAFAADLLTPRGDAFDLFNVVVLPGPFRAWVGPLFRRFAAFDDFIGVTPPGGLSVAPRRRNKRSTRIVHCDAFANTFWLDPSYTAK